jgi:YD repeat-containing protein
VLNRVTLATYGDGTSAAYRYDQGQNGIGRLSQITDMSGDTQYSYDSHGRVVADVRTIGGHSYTTAYRYDAGGRLAGMNYPSGRAIDYAFDASGQIVEVTTTYAGVTQVLVTQVVYQPFGPLQSLVFGNGQTYARTYDLNGRMTSYTLNGQVQTVTWDAASRVTGVTDGGDAANNRTYGYDALDRLTSEQRPTSSLVYSFDSVGNRLQKTLGAATTNYTYAAASNRLTQISGSQSASIATDANGSITNNGTAQFNYDARGRMVSANTAIGLVTYTLNALGQRVQKVVGGESTVFHYDLFGKLIGEENSQTATEYIYLGDIPVAVLR